VDGERLGGRCPKTFGWRSKGSGSQPPWCSSMYHGGWVLPGLCSRTVLAMKCGVGVTDRGRLKLYQLRGEKPSLPKKERCPYMCT